MPHLPQRQHSFPTQDHYDFVVATSKILAGSVALSVTDEFVFVYRGPSRELARRYHDLVLADFGRYTWDKRGNLGVVLEGGVALPAVEMDDPVMALELIYDLTNKVHVRLQEVRAEGDRERQLSGRVSKSQTHADLESAYKQLLDQLSQEMWRQKRALTETEAPS